MSDALKTLGCTLHYSTGGSPTSFSLLGNIIDMNGLDGALTMIDSSDLDSVAAEFIGGLVDEGNFAVTLKFNPDNTGHQALRDARYSGTKIEFKLTLTDTTPTTIIFNGYVTTFPLSLPFNDRITASMGIKVSGRAVWA